MRNICKKCKVEIVGTSAQHSDAYHYHSECKPQMAFPTKAISIRQPWGHHILHSGKDVENRPRRSHYRGNILIHASLTMADKEYCLKNDLAIGGIIGMVEIYDCVEQLDSEWWIGPYGYLLRNPVALEFIPCKGALSIFTPNIDFSKLKITG